MSDLKKEENCNGNIDRSNELSVIFRNEFNEKVIKNMNQSEHDLLMCVIAKLKNKGLEELSLSIDEINDLMGTDYGNQYIIELSKSLWDKIKMTDYTIYAHGKPSGGVMLFSYWGIDDDENNLKVQLNPSLEYFLNSFKNGNYSSMRYIDFKNTKGKYGKLLYRLLIQWKGIGKVKISFKDLIEKLDVSESYRKRAYIFNQKALEPAMKECEKCFDNLEVKKIKRGNKIKAYEFTFTPINKSLNFDENKYKKKDARKIKDPADKELNELNDDDYILIEQKILRKEALTSNEELFHIIMTKEMRAQKITEELTNYPY